MNDTLVLVKRSGRDVLAVKQQVDREALEAWGKRQYKPFVTIPPIKGGKMEAAPLWAFVREIRKIIP